MFIRKQFPIEYVIHEIITILGWYISIYVVHYFPNTRRLKKIKYILRISLVYGINIIINVSFK